MNAIARLLALLFLLAVLLPSIDLAYPTVDISCPLGPPPIYRALCTSYGATQFGDLTLVMYTNSTATLAFFRNSATGQSSTVVLSPKLPAISKFDLTTQNDLFILAGGANTQNPLAFFHFSISGSPLPNSATTISNQTIASSDKMYYTFGKFKSGGLLVIWLDSYVTNGAVTLGFTYRNPATGEVTTSIIVTPKLGAITTQTSYTIAQHPADDSIWVFAKQDGANVINAWHFTELSTGLRLDWTNNSFIDGDLMGRGSDGLNGPEGENPGVAAIADPISNKIILAYPSAGPLFFPKISGMSPLENNKGTRIAVAQIDANGGKTFIRFENDWIKMLSTPQLGTSAGKIWVRYVEVSHLARSDGYLVFYENGVWGQQKYMGSFILTGSARAELVQRSSDGQMHIITSLAGPNAPNPPLPHINSTSTKDIIPSGLGYPNIGSVLPLNTSPGDALTCYGTAIDPEGQNVNIEGSWYRNNTLMQSFTNSVPSGGSFQSVLDGSNTKHGDVWNCRVRYNDGSDYTAWVDSVNMSVFTPRSVFRPPDRPQNVTIRTLDGSGSTKQQLICSAFGTDPDGDSLQIYGAWYKNGANAGLFGSLKYPNGSTIDSNSYDLDGKTVIGDVWRCGLQVVDNYNKSEWANSSNQVTITTSPEVLKSIAGSNRVPIATPHIKDVRWDYCIHTLGYPCSSGINWMSRDFFCYDSLTDPDGDKMNLTLKWYRNGVFQYKTHPMVLPNGAYHTKYTNGTLFSNELWSDAYHYLAQDSPGAVWQCSMQVCDSAGCSPEEFSSNMTLRQTGSFAIFAPNPTTPHIGGVDGSNSTMQDLYCYDESITDSDFGALNVTVKWYKNNAVAVTRSFNNNYPSGSYFRDTLAASYLTIGDIWKCEMQLFDGKTYGDKGISRSWSIVSSTQPPAQKCSDNTPYGSCSQTQPKYCDNGQLVDRCGSPNYCGCPSGQNCNASNNACYTPVNPPQTCSDGTVYGQCSLTLPKYCANGVIVDNCTECGCSGSLSCNATNKSCYTPVAPPVNRKPNTPSLTMRSAANTNTTGEDLTCSATISDPDGDRLNVTVNWYNKGAITRVDFYKNQTSNTKFDSIVGAGNLTIGDQWMCKMMLNDSRLTSDWGQSNTVTIVGGTPSNVCSDGTVYSQCSNNIPLYCNSGALVSLCEVCGCPSGQTCETDTETCFMPTPSPSTGSGGGGGGGGGGTPSEETPENGAASGCTNHLTITVADNIIIPQRITKDVNMMVTNTGTCPLSSLAAALTLPTGWTASTYNLANGLGVDESQGITITVIPPDIEPGVYNAVLKFDAPGLSEEKQVKVSLIENAPYEVVIREVPIVERVFTYIVFLLIVEFGVGAVIILIWEKPRHKLPPMLPLPALPPAQPPIEPPETI